jgi:channel protein (hemolysin III family)
VPPAFPRCRPFTAPYDRAELLVDGLLHAAGLAFALFGLVFLTEKAQVLPPVRTASVWIYGVGLVSMFAMSAAYNFWPNFSAKLILRRFDQSAIFLFIAATYTPFIALARAEPSGALLAGVWAVALIGVVLKLGCPGRFERLAIILCLALGWSGLLVGIRLVPPVSGHAHPKRWRSLFIGRGVSPLGPTPISEHYLARVRALRFRASILRHI